MQVIKSIDGRDHFWLFVKDGRTLYTLQGIVGEIAEEPESEQKFSRFFNMDDYGPEAIEFVLHVLDPSHIVEAVVEYFQEQYGVTRIRIGQAKVHYGKRLTGLYPAWKNFNR